MKMEQIELVIKMPREDYALIMSGRFYLGGSRGNGKTITSNLMKSICRGTLLPSGHGALKDVSKFLYECKLDYGCERICDCTNCVHHVIRERDVGNALTIIEADKEGAEE